MAINVRLSPEADEVLTALATSQSISKNEAVIRAIFDQGTRASHSEDVRPLAQQVVNDYRPLLERLAQ